MEKVLTTEIKLHLWFLNSWIETLETFQTFVIRLIDLFLLPRHRKQKTLRHKEKGFSLLKWKPPSFFLLVQSYGAAKHKSSVAKKVSRFVVLMQIESTRSVQICEKNTTIVSIAVYIYIYKYIYSSWASFVTGPGSHCTLRRINQKPHHLGVDALRDAFSLRDATGFFGKYLSETFVFPEMFLLSKSQKMPNHTNTWNHQTTDRKIWATPKRDTRWCIPQIPSCNMLSRQRNGTDHLTMEVSLHRTIVESTPWEYHSYLVQLSGFRRAVLWDK